MVKIVREYNLGCYNIKHFDAFLIRAVWKEKNSKANYLVVSLFLLIPHLEFEKDVYLVKNIYRPSVFDNDQHIISFLEVNEFFSNIFFEGTQSFASQQQADGRVEKEPQNFAIKREDHS